jgi:hypothetical protein
MQAYPKSDTNGQRNISWFLDFWLIVGDELRTLTKDKKAARACFQGSFINAKHSSK